MKSITLTEEEIASMSYDDVAYLILEKNQNKMKIQDLFKEVIKTMNLGENAFEEHLADFFELLSTDKRFIMVDKGFWDLKINHSTKLIIDDDEEEEITVDIDEETEEEIEEEINYDEDIVDDDVAEDDLKDLVILDENEENDMI